MGAANVEAQMLTEEQKMLNVEGGTNSKTSWAM